MASSVEIPEELLATFNLSDFRIVKNENRCATLETPDCFYKIREFTSDNPLVYFDCILGEAFAEEYERIGIEWEYFTRQFDDRFFEIEKRQKLKLLTSNQCSLEEAVSECQKTATKIERKLGFSDAVRQIRTELQFDNVKRIFIKRDNAPSLDDFACLNGQIICLGTSSRYLALADAEGNLLKDKEDIVKMLDLSFGRVGFASASLSVNDKTGQFYTSNYGRWWIYSEGIGKKLISDCYGGGGLQEMNKTNLRILAEHVAYPVYCIDESNIRVF